jgi:beta-galactosidase
MSDASDEVTGTARTWYDVIEAKGAEPIVLFTDDYFAGNPAVTRHSYGDGAAYYIGTELDRSTLNGLFDRVSREIGLEPVLPALPQGVEAVCRNGVEESAAQVIFLINHNNCDVGFTITDRYTDLITEAIVQGPTVMQANGVMVLERLP